MTLFEDICFDLLLEGKSPEEILSMLKYKFKNVPENIIEQIFNLDPTKKKSYTQWVLTHWQEESRLIQDMIRNGKLKKVFDYIFERKDIQLQAYKTVKEMATALLGATEEAIEVDDVDLLTKDSDGPENDFNIVFRSGNWIIAVPNTYQADAKLGVGSNWCTAGGNGNYNGKMYFDRYLADYGGCYFVNFNTAASERGEDGKVYPYKRYQFHFESKQFMNIHDDPVNLEDIDMPQEAYEFYESKGYNLSEYGGVSEQQMDQYLERRWNDGYSMSECLSIMREFNDDYEWDENDNASYYVYNSYYDDRDPIDYIRVSPIPIYSDEENDIYIVNGNPNDNTNFSIGELPSYFGEREYKPIVLKKDDDNYSFTETISFYCLTPDKKNLFYISEGNNGGSAVGFAGNVFSEQDFQIVPNTKRFSVNSENQLAVENVMLSDINFPGVNYLYEISWDNGYHSLVGLSSEGGIEFIIRADIPANGERFVNENGVIKGKFKTYGATEEKEMKFSHIISQFDDEHYLVAINSEGTLKNILDTKTNNLALEGGFNIIFNSNIFIKDTVIAGDLNTGVALYSLTTGKMLTPKYKKYGVGAADILWFSNNKYYLTTRDLQTHGPFIHVTNTLNEPRKIFLQKEGAMESVLFDEAEGKFVMEGLRFPPNPFTNNRTAIVAQKDNNVILLSTKNYKVLAIDLSENELIGRKNNTDERNQCLIEGFGIFQFKDGKFNAVNIENGQKLLPHNVDFISNREFYEQYKKFKVHFTMIITIVVDGDRCFLYDNNGNVHPSPQGLRCDNGKVDADLFEFTANNIKFSYNISENDFFVDTETIPNYDDKNNFYAWRSIGNLDEKTRNYLYSLIMPQSQQANIMREFKEFLRRMDDLNKE